MFSIRNISYLFQCVVVFEKDAKTVQKLARVNTLIPRLTKPFFVTRLTKGGGVVTTPSLEFPNRTPYEVDFGINR